MSFFNKFILAAIVIILGGLNYIYIFQEKENKTIKEEMVAYLEEKYNEPFEVVRYIPAEIEPDEFTGGNTLIVKSEKGLYINVREKYANEDKYSDDYLDALASEKVNKEIDYSGIEEKIAAKTYVQLIPNVFTYEELKNKESGFSKEDAVFVITLIAISKEPDEKNMKELYEVYKEVHSLQFENVAFIVSFSGSEKKSIDYITNYFTYNGIKWNLFDKSMGHRLEVYESGLSFEEFKTKIYFF